jgi:hypothetical protein
MPFGVYLGCCVDGMVRPVSDRMAPTMAGVGRTVPFVAPVSAGRPRRSDTGHALSVRPGMGNGALRGAMGEVKR